MLFRTQISFLSLAFLLCTYQLAQRPFTEGLTGGPAMSCLRVVSTSCTLGAAPAEILQLSKAAPVGFLCRFLVLLDTQADQAA